MEKGVAATKAKILFFSDADLVGLTPEIVREIIQPVQEQKTEMSIGIRNNITQKSWKFIAHLSGERALHWDLWESIPTSLKKRYHIETGLNITAKSRGLCVKSQILPYYQTFKEQKYGFLRGTMLRWWMYADVVIGTVKARILS